MTRRESRPGGYSETASKSTARTNHDLTRCLRCRRPLRAVLGVSRLRGPVCWRKCQVAELVAA